MALKDWEKVKDSIGLGGIAWIIEYKGPWTKQYGERYYITLKKRIAVDEDGNLKYFWFVKTNDTGHNSKRFKTKAEAQKYARDYMRKHDKKTKHKSLGDKLLGI